jgi:hypothetical protein
MVRGFEIAKTGLRQRAGSRPGETDMLMRNSYTGQFCGIMAQCAGT